MKTAEVKFLGGEYFIELDEETCNNVGLEEGDSIVWENNGDGSFSLRKVEDND